MTAPSPVQFIPYGRDPLEAAATFILGRFAPRLPDLSRIVVLLPRGGAGQALRRHLLSEASSSGGTALLGPVIAPLRRWVERVSPMDEPVPNPYAGELMLVEAMLEHPGLFGDGNPWAVAASLIGLFEELTLHQVPLPDDLDDFTQRLGTAYGLRQPLSRPLTREAQLVYTLWRAWHEQIRAEGMTDGQQAYLHQLSAATARAPQDAHFVFVGHDCLLPAELEFVRGLTAQGRATLILHGDAATHPLAEQVRALAPPPPGAAGDSGHHGAYGAFLDQVYAHAAIPDPEPAPPPSLNTARRARAFRSRYPHSPACDRLSVFEARGPEQEAQAVELQVRRWLLEGRRRIGIVTGDRRLARRVRALLERAGVALRDAGGWALSTTSAAAALERWLEAVEEDFHHQPLLDLLRSPFALPDWERGRLQATVFRLEQDIIIHENIARGLPRYRRALAARHQRLVTAEASGVHQLLDEIERAASPLKPLIKGARRSPGRLLDAVLASMQALGLRRTFAQDGAGMQLLQLIDRLRHGVSRRGITMDWMEFRAWLGRALESAHFTPAPAPANVELLPLEHGPLGRFDALVIAALDRTQLPGEPHAAPFFNNAVRRELGLPGVPQRRRELLHRFRALLEGAPRVLLTACLEKDGERIAPSPWLELLQSFHRMAYGQRLDDAELEALVRLPATQVIGGDGAPLPRRRAYPRPRADRRLIPPTVTATAHQQLIDCPYQFFAARCLALAPPEPVTERLSKSDYGERIHRVLQAFHAPVPGLPGPFDEPVTERNRDRAKALLQAISSAVFAKDLEDNFLHRGWLRRWEALFDDYLDWQTGRACEWRVKDVEVSAVDERFAALFHIRGRLDRIDTGKAGLAIIDYKTGEVPSGRDIQSGEAVQLPFYTLLMDEPVTRVEYLCLDRNRFGSRASLEGENLAVLREQTAARLRAMMEQLHEGTPLPAWGDERTCNRCRMAGLCRKQAWQAVPQPV